MSNSGVRPSSTHTLCSGSSPRCCAITSAILSMCARAEAVVLPAPKKTSRASRYISSRSVGFGKTEESGTPPVAFGSTSIASWELGSSRWTRVQNFSSSRRPTSRVDAADPSARTDSQRLIKARAAFPSRRGNRESMIVSSSLGVGDEIIISCNLCAPKKREGGNAPVRDGTTDLVAKMANPSAATIRPRLGTSRIARWPIHFPGPSDSTSGLRTPRTSLLPRSISLNTTHRPWRIDRTKTPSFHSNVPGWVGEETYDPSKERGSREVSARWM
ncbi:hypothetical protein DFH07DRAFT_808773 [Mycena maculata]|uniref:Uncharacterized protein n=1 Tax=Mycena maculata TaxID=230809 RepID=A0AAD7NMI3_9AGAR|nr:hypothetical protein DFH07DRAFT_808773 [Mycena maculata]